MSYMMSNCNSASALETKKALLPFVMHSILKYIRMDSTLSITEVRDEPWRVIPYILNNGNATQEYSTYLSEVRRSEFTGTFNRWNVIQRDLIFHAEELRIFPYGASQPLERFDSTCGTNVEILYKCLGRCQIRLTMSFPSIHVYASFMFLDKTLCFSSTDLYLRFCEQSFRYFKAVTSL